MGALTMRHADVPENSSVLGIFSVKYAATCDPCG